MTNNTKQPAQPRPGSEPDDAHLHRDENQRQRDDNQRQRDDNQRTRDEHQREREDNDVGQSEDTDDGKTAA
jgi:hypothetical protein